MPNTNPIKIKNTWTYESLLADLRHVAQEKVTAVHTAAANGSLTGTDAWYQASYSVFTAPTQTVPSTIDDFVRVIAFAYSWVATIPDADPRPLFYAVQAAIAAVKSAEVSSPYNVSNVRNSRTAAIRSVQSALAITSRDVSVVIASKVLHFWAPDCAPMIDVNVANGWTKLKRRCHWSNALSSSGNSRIKTISQQPRREQFLSYWELAYQLKKSPGGIGYRELDELMFCYGR